MAREEVYPAMTRGRHLNRTYIATDLPDPDCPTPTGDSPALPGPRQILGRILVSRAANNVVVP